MARHLLAAVLISCLAGSAFVALGQSAQPRWLVQVDGKLLSPPSGQGRWVAWIDGDTQRGRLVVARRHGGQARAILTGQGLSGLAVAGDFGLLTRTETLEDGTLRSSLLRVNLRDGTSKMLGQVAKGADQMVWGEGWICWRETRDSALPGVPFVLAAPPMTIIRARPEDVDRVYAVAALAGRPSEAAEQISLIGIAHGQIYWIEHEEIGQRESTLIRRAALPDGQPETVIREQGLRTAALMDGALLWTARSLEAAEPSQFAAVKRRALNGLGIQAVADWIDREAVLLASHDGTYAQGRDLLWCLGKGREQQQHFLKGPPGILAAWVLGDEEYLVMRRRGGLVIGKRPLTWQARVRSLVLR